MEVLECFTSFQSCLDVNHSVHMISHLVSSVICSPMQLASHAAYPVMSLALPTLTCQHDAPKQNNDTAAIVVIKPSPNNSPLYEKDNVNEFSKLIP